MFWTQPFNAQQHIAIHINTLQSRENNAFRREKRSVDTAKELLSRDIPVFVHELSQFYCDTFLIV